MDYKAMIEDLEIQISMLPIGYISKKNINGNVYYYRQWSENGKVKSKYIKKNELEQIEGQIAKRKRLEKQLKELKSQEKTKVEVVSYVPHKERYKTNVVFGTALLDMGEAVRGFEMRACVRKLINYLNSPEVDKVCILYGLKRTGKTTLIRQVLLDMPKIQLDRCAYIKIMKSNTMAELAQDLKELFDKKVRYVFIEDITNVSDFVESASVLSDVFAATGMKIVLSSQEPLNFWKSVHGELYQRAEMIHTTFISYREYSLLMNNDDIDRYLEYGGVLGNDRPKFDEDIGKSSDGLLEIDSEIKTICHNFLSKIITKEDIDKKLGITTKTSIWDRRREKQSQPVIEPIPYNRKAINLLKDLDYIEECPVERINDTVEDTEEFLFTQPGRKYLQSKELINVFLKKLKFDTLSEADKKTIIKDTLEEIKNCILKDTVLMETYKGISKRYRAFRVHLPEGSFDMVVYDTERNECTVFEIVNAKKIHQKHYKNLVDEDKLHELESRFGKITTKYILYRGEDYFDDDKIMYLNVENYLKQL